MLHVRRALRARVGTDEGQSMLELSMTMVVAFVLVALAFTAYQRLAPGGTVPLEQCIEHQSCQSAAHVHGYAP